MTAEKQLARTRVDHWRSLPMYLSLVVAVSMTPPRIRASDGNDKLKGPNTGPRNVFTQAPKSRAPIATSFSQPVSFIENLGQFDPQVRFYLKSGNKVLWFTDQGIVFDVTRERKSDSVRSEFRPAPSTKKQERLVFTEKFLAGNKGAKVTACAWQPGTYNFFLGKDTSKWRTGARGYSQLVYHDVWPGIDVRFVAKQQDLEQEFLVHPGANPQLIRIAYSGIERLKVARDGSLSTMTAFGVLTERRPAIYQEGGQGRIPKRGRFMLAGNSGYGFRVDSFDRQRDLVIDPTLLYSTFLGGSAADQANGIAADASGNAYVTGLTNSGDFPTTPGTFAPTPGLSSGFVTKFGPNGLPIYSTFLGPTDGSGLRGIAIDQTGDAYVTGTHDAGSFPVTSNAYSLQGNAVFAILGPSGNSLIYSTVFGIGCVSSAIAVDNAGRAYITGSGNNAPITAGAYQSTSNALHGGNAFLAVFDPSMSGTASLVYGTLLGGSTNDGGDAIAVDAYGNAYIAGITFSLDFPTTRGALQTSNRGSYPQCGGGSCQGGNAFVAKINPNASGSASLIYSTYLGGSTTGLADQAFGIAVDSSGGAYVTGVAWSVDFPITPGAFRTYPPGRGFISKFDAGGSHLVYSSFLDGSAASVAIDPAGNSYVIGSTGDPSFPVTPSAFQPVYKPSAGSEAFLIELNGQGTTELYGTFLGGSSRDNGQAIALDAVGDAYMTGYTTSPDFPVSAFAFQPVLKGNTDAFVTKLGLGASGGLAITGIVPVAGGNAGTVTPQIIGSGFHAGATAQLNCGAQPVSGTNATLGPMGRTLNTTFDLTSTQPGTCDVVVTNVDGTSAILPAAFTVQQGGASNVQLSVVGVAVRQGPSEVLDAPTNAVFYVTVQNGGNIDLPGGILSLPLSSPFAGSSADPPDLAPQTSTVEIWGGGPLPAGSAQNFAATATTGSIQNSTATNAEGSGSIQIVPTTITSPTCDTLVIKIDACYYPNPVIHPVALDACVVNSPTFQLSCGTAAGQCLVKCGIAALITGPGFLGCLGTCLATNGTACLIGSLPAINSCLESTSSPGQPVCTYGPIHCYQPNDPNSLTGPAGVGSEQWVSAAQPLTYLITFENKSDATAPAQEVIVTQPLPGTLDLSKLELLTITVPNGTSAIAVNIPAGLFDPLVGLNEFVTTVDLRPTQSVLVDVDAKLDGGARTLTWTFTTIDPSTGQSPLNPLIGFLPASSSGSVGFTVTPNSTVATGTQISDQATILFIGNSPMSTPVWTNTIDNTAPASALAPLPAIESSLSFPVNWSGSDVGSGIGSYTIYVSDNGGPFTAWQTNTTATSSTYTGTAGHTYGFYSIATDLVGNVEAGKTAAEATTTVQGTSTCATDVSSQVTITPGGFRLNHATNMFVQTVTLTNNGAPLSNVSLVLDALSTNATLSNSGGSTQCDAPLGSPWIAVPGAIATGKSVSVTLNFNNPTNAGISYTTRILAGSGQQ